MLKIPLEGFGKICICSAKFTDDFMEVTIDSQLRLSTNAESSYIKFTPMSVPSEEAPA